jgi:hypothetical protein
MCRIDCLAYQDEILNNPLDVKENDEHALDFAFAYLTFSGVCEFGLFYLEDCCFVSGS